MKKVESTERQFAELVLYHWLSSKLSDEAIKTASKDLKFSIKSKKAYNKIFRELFLLNMWIIVDSCELMLEDVDKRNRILDIFHYFVFKNLTDKPDGEFLDWMRLISKEYSRYWEAMKTDHPSTPLWVVSKLFNENLFGELKLDAFLQMTIANYVVIDMKYLREAINEYEIV